MARLLFLWIVMLGGLYVCLQILSSGIAFVIGVLFLLWILSLINAAMRRSNQEGQPPQV